MEVQRKDFTNHRQSLLVSQDKPLAAGVRPPSCDERRASVSGDVLKIYIALKLKWILGRRLRTARRNGSAQTKTCIWPDTEPRIPDSSLAWARGAAVCCQPGCTSHLQRLSCGV